MYDKNNFSFPPENKAVDVAYYLHPLQELQIFSHMIFL